MPTLPSTSGRLDGRRALVTGAARGIGAATALALADAGADVVALDVSSSEATCAAVRALGGRAENVRVDLTDRGALGESVNRVIDGGGPIDLLVNNAGIISTSGFLDIDDAEWDRVVAINLTGPLLVTRLCWPGMIQVGGGSIVYVTSRAARTGGDNAGPAYVTTKAALEGLAISAAKEGAKHNIRANAVMPGPTATDMTRKLNHASETAGMPLGRMAAPEDIAQAVLYLCSQQSNYVTGTVINVTGGLLFG